MSSSHQVEVVDGEAAIDAAVSLEMLSLLTSIALLGIAVGGWFWVSFVGPEDDDHDEYGEKPNRRQLQRALFRFRLWRAKVKHRNWFLWLWRLLKR